MGPIHSPTFAAYDAAMNASSPMTLAHGANVHVHDSSASARPRRPQLLTASAARASARSGAALAGVGSTQRNNMPPSTRSRLDRAAPAREAPTIWKPAGAGRSLTADRDFDAASTTPASSPAQNERNPPNAPWRSGRLRARSPRSCARRAQAGDGGPRECLCARARGVSPGQGRAPRRTGVDRHVAVPGGAAFAPQAPSSPPAGEFAAGASPQPTSGARAARQAASRTGSGRAVIASRGPRPFQTTWRRPRYSDTIRSPARTGPRRPGGRGRSTPRRRRRPRTDGWAHHEQQPARLVSVTRRSRLANNVTRCPSSVAAGRLSGTLRRIVGGGVGPLHVGGPGSPAARPSHHTRRSS
jgi:hypothetical protein